MGNTSWLTKQRKQDLIDLGDHVGYIFTEAETHTKPDVIEALETFLENNEERFSDDARFDGFYLARKTPRKPARDASDDGEAVRSVVRGRGRKATTSKVKSEPEDDNEYSAARSPTVSSPTAQAPSARRTPAASILQRRRSSLPPSPTVVADEVEHATTRFYAGLDDLYTLSGIPETLDWARECCSSLAAVHLTIILLEGYNLSRWVMPWNYLFDIPAIRPFGPGFGTPSIAVSYPDLFVLLSASFWYPTLIWAATNVLIPLFVAYFYNLTVHTVKRNGARVRVVRYNYDPFVFNIARALLISVTYGTPLLWPYIDSDAIGVVELSQFGGFPSMIMASFIGAFCSLWEATQR